MNRCEVESIKEPQFDAEMEKLRHAVLHGLGGRRESAVLLECIERCARASLSECPSILRIYTHLIEHRAG